MEDCLVIIYGIPIEEEEWHWLQHHYKITVGFANETHHNTEDTYEKLKNKAAKDFGIVIFDNMDHDAPMYGYLGILLYKVDLGGRYEGEYLKGPLPKTEPSKSQKEMFEKQLSNFRDRIIEYNSFRIFTDEINCDKVCDKLMKKQGFYQFWV